MMGCELFEHFLFLDGSKHGAFDFFPLFGLSLRRFLQLFLQNM